jgi:gamma-glutamyltranspeptidase/glutathione hydrolase
MMGEDDLHPEGFHSGRPGERVISMMSPSVVLKDTEVRLVLGSGGSKRIRTAISQVLSQIIDYKQDVATAVNSPRLHWDGEVLQMEPGFPPESIDTVSRLIPINLWQERNVYFGGVHTVVPGAEGVGDPRRGGAVITVSV